MNALVNYSIEVSILFVILFLIYQFLFYRNTYFKIRKATLFVLLVVSFVAPSIEIKAPQKVSENLRSIAPIVELVMPPIEPKAKYSELIEPTAKNTSSQWSKQDLISVVFVIGWAISLSILIIELIKSYLKLKGAKKTKINFSDQVKSPFSLFKKIFLPSDLLKHTNQTDVIIAHEEYHCVHNHTIELVLVHLIQTLLWYNPISYWFLRELKLLNEALADKHVSELYGQKIYLEALLSVKLSSFDFSLQHTFNSQITRRLELMNIPKTKIRNTIYHFSIFTILAVLSISFSSLKGQSIDNSNIVINHLNPINNFYLRLLIQDEISERHKKVLSKLKELNPFEDILISYTIYPADIEYSGIIDATLKPLYIGILSESEKIEIYEKALSDDKRLKMITFFHDPEKRNEPSTIFDIKEDIKTDMMNNDIYIMFYNIKEFGEEVYSYEDVDIKPEPIGGLEAFERSIALDITLPKNMKREDLPSKIEYEAIVDAHSLANINLVTELKGSEHENLSFYRFFGKVLQDINQKSSTVYKWKRGIKDGKEVKTQVRISIPTAYFN